MVGYPAQISLIPSTVALIRFIERNGLASWHPFWYLGNPLRYLIGPIVPLVCLALHRIFPSLNLVETISFLIIGFFVLGPLGLFFFVRKLSRNWKLALISCLLFAFLPFHYFAGLAFGNGTFILALMSLPWVFWLGLLALEKWNRRWVALASITVALVILIDSLILFPLGIGLILLGLASKSAEEIEKRIAKVLFLLALGWLLTFCWFSPGYWLTILKAPSLGGRGLFSATVWLGKILMNLVPIVLAIFSVTRLKKIKDKTAIFVLGWLAIFGFLTVMRFLSDPDFLMDWSSYGVELEMGIAMLAGIVIGKKKRFFGVCALAIILLAAIWGYAWRWTPLLIPRKNIEETVEYRISRQLSEIAKPGERVFLSGSTAFWLNSFSDIPQVRGGKDEASIHPTWRQAVWEIREGTDSEKSEEWLKELGVSYLVVHTQESEELYHDFTYLDKFEAAKSLKKVFSDRGDIIYQVEGAEKKEREFKDQTEPIGWGISLLGVASLFLFPKSWNLLSTKLPKFDLGGEEDY